MAALSLLLVAAMVVLLVFGVWRWRKRSDAAFLPAGFSGSGFLRGKRYRRDLNGRGLQITMFPPRRYVGATIEIVLDAATRSRASIGPRVGPEWLRELFGVREIPLGPGWEQYLARGEAPEAVARWATSAEVAAIVSRLVQSRDVAFCIVVEPGRLVVRGQGAPYSLVEGPSGRAWVEQLLRDLPQLASAAERLGI